MSFVFLCISFVLVERKESCVHKPLVYSQHKRHPLTASRASAERTRYSGVGSTSKRCVQCNFSAQQVRQEATEWSDKVVGRLGGVWGPSVRHIRIFMFPQTVVLRPLRQT